VREAEKLEGGRPIGRRQRPPVFPLLTKGLGQSPALCFTVGSVMGFCRVPDDAEGLCESPEEAQLAVQVSGIALGFIC